MAKFMNNTRWILTTLFIVLFGLSSCDDDDKSLEDMRDEIIANSNDVCIICNDFICYRLFQPVWCNCKKSV